MKMKAHDFLKSIFLLSFCFSLSSYGSDLCRQAFQSQKTRYSAEEIKSIEQLAEALTKGLQLSVGENVLWNLYQNSFFPNPKKTKFGIDRVFDILKTYPELSKPVFREQFLTFQSSYSLMPEELKTYVLRFKKNSFRLKTPLMRIEENVPYWSKVMNIAKEENKKNQRDKLQQKLISLLGLDLINDLKNNDNEENILKLYHILEAERQVMLSQQPILEAERQVMLSQQPILEAERQVMLSQQQPVHFISQALLDLIHTAGFSKNHRDMNSRNPFVVLISLEEFLKYREDLSVTLGFKSFMDFKDSLKIRTADKDFYDTDRLLDKVLYFKNQLHVRSELKTERVRALSLYESPFRSCFTTTDCSSSLYFDKGLDPNFIYWTKSTEHAHTTLGEQTSYIPKHLRSSGQVTTVLGLSKNSKGALIKTAFIDKIQSVPIEDIVPFLSSIKRSLKEEGYTLALSPEVGGNNGLSVTIELRHYVKNELLPKLSGTLLKGFTPHPHQYMFFSGSSRAYDKLDSIEFDLEEEEGVVTSKEEGVVTSKEEGIVISEEEGVVTSKEEGIVISKEEGVVTSKEEGVVTSKEEGIVISEEEGVVISKEEGVVTSKEEGVVTSKEEGVVTSKEEGVVISEGEKYKPYVLENLTKDHFIENILSLKHSSNLEDIISFLNNLAFLNKERLSGFSNKEVSVILSDLLQDSSLSDFQLRKKILYELMNFDFDKFLFFFKTLNQEEQSLIKGEISNWDKGKDQNKQEFFKVFQIGFDLLGQEWIEVLAPIFDKKELKTSDTENLFLLVKKSCLSLTKKFIEDKEIDIDHLNAELQTYLMLAAQYGHLDIAKLLFEKGADLNIRSPSGKTALWWAVKNKHLELAEWLLKNGADVNPQYLYDKVPLIEATQQDHLEMLNLLLKNGADINAKNFYGKTALMIAIQKGHLELAELLIEKGADIHAKDSSGMTALMLVAQYGYLEMAELLIQKGADINATNHRGEKALNIAIQHGHLDIAKRLKEKEKEESFIYKFFLNWRL